MGDPTVTTSKLQAPKLQTCNATTSCWRSPLVHSKAQINRSAASGWVGPGDWPELSVALGVSPSVAARDPKEEYRHGQAGSDGTTFNMLLLAASATSA